MCICCCCTQPSSCGDKLLHWPGRNHPPASSRELGCSAHSKALSPCSARQQQDPLLALSNSGNALAPRRFSPTWYQTHALENRGSSFCCTVQGFCYSSEDSVHWPFMEFAVRVGREYVTSTLAAVTTLWTFVQLKAATV